MMSLLFVNDNMQNAFMRLPPSSVDLVFLDPPWMAGDRTANGYSYTDSMNPIEYVREIVEPTLEGCRRVLKEGGCIAVWTDYRANPYWCIAIDDSHEFTRNGELIVESTLGNPGKSKHPVKHSNILFASNGIGYFDYTKMETVARRSAPKPGYEGDKRIGSVIQGTMSNTDPQRVGYPDQKPFNVCRHVIETMCPLRGVVLDPFCGSGTIPIQSGLSGMVGIGFDISAKAISLCAERAKNEGLKFKVN